MRLLRLVGCDGSIERSDREGDASTVRPTLDPGDLPLLGASASTTALDARVALELIDRLPFGVAVLSPDATVIATNPEADALLEGGACSLRVDRGRLLPPDARVARRWLDRLAMVTQADACLAEIEGLMPVALSPLHDRRLGPLVVCTFSSRSRRDAEVLQVFATRYRLTDSEADVLRLLAAGATPKRIALRRGTTEGTVRSQLKTVLLKTGTHSLRDVAGALLRVPPMLRDDRSELDRAVN